MVNSSTSPFAFFAPSFHAWPTVGWFWGTITSAPPGVVALNACMTAASALSRPRMVGQMMLRSGIAIILRADEASGHALRGGRHPLLVRGAVYRPAQRFQVLVALQLEVGRAYALDAADAERHRRHRVQVRVGMPRRHVQPAAFRGRVSHPVEQVAVVVGQEPLAADQDCVAVHRTFSRLLTMVSWAAGFRPVASATRSSAGRQ